jgi:hypothetical protein
MSIGSVTRKVLGKRLFRVAGRIYRAVFVDLREVALACVKAIPEGAHVLDIGGGDGEPINHLLELRSDLRFTMVDLNPVVGSSIRAEHLAKVERLPGTSIREYLESGRPMPQAIMINDVLHHVPPPHRPTFFADLRELVERAKGAVVIIKDVEPGTFRANLSYWADKYISGDKTVSLVSRGDLTRTLHGLFGDVAIRETPLFAKDAPNYSVVFSVP